MSPARRKTMHNLREKREKPPDLPFRSCRNVRTKHTKVTKSRAGMAFPLKTGLLNCQKLLIQEDAWAYPALWFDFGSPRA